ncbi:hypothetical protein KSP40_PGU019507 [Platanthera guangdongensis]|uniref:Uncharacterized protein n=1 Tax=Platanthera guangdongensis TaxID=2320717 RepID=A0ABR2N0M5_9ASPA
MKTILQQSARLTISSEDFLSNSRLMRNAGLSAGTVVRVFEQLPAAFMRDGIDFCRRIEFLKNTVRIVDSEDEINRICHSFPEFLAFPIDGRLRPLFSELSDLGFDRIEVRKLLTQNPSLLLGVEPGELSRCVNLLRGLKCRVPIKEKILSNGLFHAAINVKLRIDFLCGHGLIRRDAFKILHVEPRSILYSLGDIEKKIQFLLTNLGFSVDHLVEFPDYLGLNLEKQISPRLQVIEILKTNGAIDMEVELKHFVRLSRRKFYNFFVKPYPECEKIFGGLIRDVRVCDEKVRTKHPAGLWKLFSPSKYSSSEEDLKNMRQFMETLV